MASSTHEMPLHSEKLNVLKRPVDDDEIAVPSEILHGKRIISAKKKMFLSSLCSNYHPLKKLGSSCCKVGLGIILGSPFVDNFGKKKVRIKSNFPNKPLRSSSSIGMMMKKNPNNPSSMLFLGESFKNSSPQINAAADYTTYSNNNHNHNHNSSGEVSVEGQSDDHHALMKKISSYNYYIHNEWLCVFAADSMSTTSIINGSKKLAICSKHRNAGFLSLEDIESTDNYSRKINYLPNPKVTHMYNYCILEFPQIQSSNNRNFNNQYPLYPPPPPPNNLSPRRHLWSSSVDEKNFLKNCETCDKLLEGQDIYIYRGDSSFCSPECRYWKVKAERGLEKVTGTVPAALATVVSDNKESIFYVSTNYKLSAAGA